MATSAPRQVPSDADLDLADYNIGSAGSDINHVRSLVEQAARDHNDRLEAAGELADGPELDRDQLARLIVWAVDTVGDVEGILVNLAAIRQDALIPYHECTTRADVDLHWQRADDWHRAALEDRGA